VLSRGFGFSRFACVLVTPVCWAAACRGDRRWAETFRGDLRAMTSGMLVGTCDGS
jgi:hypothetical protein